MFEWNYEYPTNNNGMNQNNQSNQNNYNINPNQILPSMNQPQKEQNIYNANANMDRIMII